MQLTLSAHPPFSFPAVVNSHGWLQLAPFTWDKETGTLAYITRLDSGRVVELQMAEAPGGVGAEVADGLSDAERGEVTRQVTWMFGLDMDFSAFYAAARHEPKLAHVEPRAQGRVLRSATLFEDTVKTITTVNTAWSGTLRMVKALVTQFGSPLPGDADRRAFPTAEQIAATDEATLRGQARLGFRAPFVLALAQKIAGGSFDLEALKTSDLPTPELRKRLLAIKGVGDYAVANLLMLLGRYDAIPVDSWALKMVSQEWHDNRPVGRAEVEAAFERWGEWRGLAYWFWDWS
jgi:3-methyladenine DNA glycosylase/8-oxoguanine DNA glycosylase